MKTDLERIENYLTGQLSPAERQLFESELRTQPALAEALAFYLLTKQLAGQEAKVPDRTPAEHDAREQRRAELNALRTNGVLLPAEDSEEINIPTRPLWGFPMQWVAAASVVLLLGLGWYFLRSSSSTDARPMADTYINDHFTQLPTTMDGGSTGSPTADSIKLGVGLFNKGKLVEAGTVFQAIHSRQPANADALKFAGIVSLRRGNYDQAIELFHQLSQRTDLFANPGTFYEALTYLKRGQPLDKNRAEKLLDLVINRNLDGKADAEVLLNRSQ